MTFGWPSREFINQHKQELTRELEPYGVYIDAGNITLHDKQRVFIYGNTRAQIDCTLTRIYRIAVMGGARAMITADGYSVVRIESDAESQAHAIAKHHGRILK